MKTPTRYDFIFPAGMLSRRAQIGDHVVIECYAIVDFNVTDPHTASVRIITDSPKKISLDFGSGFDVGASIELVSATAPEFLNTAAADGIQILTAVIRGEISNIETCRNPDNQKLHIHGYCKFIN